MEIITMESSAYKELLDKIEKIAGYVRESERERTRKKDAADVEGYSEFCIFQEFLRPVVFSIRQQV